MDLHLARLRDWRSRDGYEHVTYNAARRPVKPAEGLVNPDPNNPLPIRAHRRSLTIREKAISGGVYTAGQLVWLAPVELFPPKFAAGPADFITDKEGIDHVVQTAQLQNYRTQWRLDTLDLTLAHSLTDTVEIERAAISTDAAGAYVKAFPPAGITLYENLPARVQLIEQEPHEERDIRGAQFRYDVYVLRQIAVSTAEDRVTWVDGYGVTHYLDILKLRNPSRIDEVPVLECVQKV